MKNIFNVVALIFLLVNAIHAADGLGLEAVDYFPQLTGLMGPFAGSTLDELYNTIDSHIHVFMGMKSVVY